jgi:hypothetical protein
MLFLSIIILGFIGCVCLYMAISIKDVKQVKNYKLQKWLSRYPLPVSKVLLIIFGLLLVALSVLEFMGWLNNKKI